jgi:pre-mRNA-splicing factor ATP-dependent RNA helicase DHX16
MLVLYVASSAKTADKLFQSLLAAEFPANADTKAFASSLYDRLPRKSKASSSSSSKPSTSSKDAGKRYGLLLEEEVASGGGLKKEKGKGKEKSDRKADKAVRKERKEKERASGEKKERGSIRKRDHDEGAWESDEEDKLSRKRAREEEDDERRRREDEAAAGPSSPRPNSTTPPPEETEEERRERERLEDLAERDAFAARIRDKDKDKTKKLVTDRSSVANESEAAKRRALAEDAIAREAAMPDLRQRSRQEYLQKREAQQMDLLRLEIIDEENLFHGQRMSRKEEKELVRKKEVLRLMEERQKIDDGYDGYQLPDDYITEQGKIDSEKKKNALYKRYDDNKKDEKSFVTDVDQWERSQADKVSYKTGAQDKVVVEDSYEFVFDESQQISWVSDGVMKGGDEMSAKDKLLQAAIAEAETKGPSHCSPAPSIFSPLLYADSICLCCSLASS